MRVYLDNCCYNTNVLMNDSVLKAEAMSFLIEKFGEVDAERFISLILEEPFDYTEWQKELFRDKSVKELYEDASSYYKKKYNIH